MFFALAFPFKKKWWGKEKDSRRVSPFPKDRRKKKEMVLFWLLLSCKKKGEFARPWSPPFSFFPIRGI